MVRPMAISLPRLTRLAWPVLVNICRVGGRAGKPARFEPTLAAAGARATARAGAGVIAPRGAACRSCPRCGTAWAARRPPAGPPTAQQATRPAPERRPARLRGPNHRLAGHGCVWVGSRGAERKGRGGGELQAARLGGPGAGVGRDGWDRRPRAASGRRRGPRRQPAALTAWTCWTALLLSIGTWAASGDTCIVSDRPGPRAGAPAPLRQFDDSRPTSTPSPTAP